MLNHQHIQMEQVIFIAISIPLSPDCVGFSEADWAGDLNDRKSTSAYVFQMNGRAVSWRSKKQAYIALSTAEAEYIVLSAAV